MKDAQMKYAIFQADSAMNYTFANFSVSFNFTIPMGRIRIRKISARTIFRDWTNSRDYDMSSTWSIGFYDAGGNGRDVGAIRPSILTQTSGLSGAQGNQGGMIFSSDLPFLCDELIICDAIALSANMLTVPGVALPASYQALNQINLWWQDK